MIISQKVVLYLITSIAAALLFISNNSFWIDEGNAAYKASQPSLCAWWHAMHSVTGSDSQMPMYMLSIWFWEKIVPSSEFWLRLSNLPWLFVLIYSLRSFRFGLVCALTCPFLIGYVSELRPYLMQLAGAALSMKGLAHLSMHESKAWKQILVGCLIMCMASLIGVVWALGPLIYFLITRSGRLKEVWFWKSSLLAAPFYILLAWYYAWTLLQGQEAAMMGGGIIVSVGAAAYELLGLAGLGPSKIALRTDPMSALHYLPVLIPASLIFTASILTGLFIYKKQCSKNQLVASVIAGSVPILLLISLVLLKDFRLLGRHLAPLSIIMILLTAIGTNHLWTTGQVHATKPNFSKARKSICLLAFSFGVLSCLSLRFNPVHSKDDYREAAKIAKAAIAENREVYWLADKWTAFYYGLNEEQQGWQDWRDGSPIPEISDSDVIIISKPDIYDKKGTFMRILEENGFSSTNKLQAFTVYKK